MSNKKFLVLTVMLLVFIVLGCKKLETNKFQSQNLKCKDCNVVVIGLTALRADHVGVYGYSKNTTPNIDSVASKSFVFKNAVSASSWTLPSFMSMFTSTYPSEHGIKNNYIRNNEGKLVRANLRELNPNIKTLAEVLNENGYVTAGFTGNVHLNRTFGYSIGFETYFDAIPFAGLETTLPLALKWLQKNRDKKFFLFIQGYDLHGRYELQNDYSGKFIGKNYSGLYKGSKEEQILLRNLSLEQGHVNLSEGDKEFWRSLYNTKLYDADARLGDFFSEIEDLGILNDSIIIILGDHGEELFERSRIDHGFSLYDELIRIPLIIYIPYSVRYKFIENQVRTIDIMPTILNIINANLTGNINGQMKGVSLTPLMNGQVLNLNAYSETDYLYKVFKRSIRKSNGWKFIYSIDTNEKELYNLNEDPGEKNNLIDKEPRIAYELEQELFKQIYGT